MSRWFLRALPSGKLPNCQDGLLAEPQVLDRLAEFVEAYSPKTSGPRGGTAKYRMFGILTPGVVELRDTPFLKASPDALCGLVVTSHRGVSTPVIAVVEIKTATTPSTEHALLASASAEDGKVIIIDPAATTDVQRRQFVRFIPNNQYRSQVIHQCAATGLRHVVFVQGMLFSPYEGVTIFASQQSEPLFI